MKISCDKCPLATHPAMACGFNACPPDQATIQRLTPHLRNIETSRGRIKTILMEARK